MNETTCSDCLYIWLSVEITLVVLAKRGWGLLPCEASDMPLSDVTTPYGLKVCSKSLFFFTQVSLYFSYVHQLLTLISRGVTMGKGCITATKYFLFLFNLLFFVSMHTHLHTPSHIPTSLELYDSPSVLLSSVKTACCTLVQCPSPWFYQFHLWASFFSKMSMP